MREATFEIRVPTDLLEYGFDQYKIQRHVTEWLVLSLFTEGQISSGKAAKLLNVPRVAFLDLLRQYGLAYINYSPEELAEGFEAAEALRLIS